VTPSLSLAQSGSDQGGNRSVPKKEREIHDVDFRVVNWVFHIWLTLTGQLCGDSSLQGVTLHVINCSP